MPRAKQQAPTPITNMGKKNVKAPPQKGKAKAVAQIKQASQPIKKAAKASPAAKSKGSTKPSTQTSVKSAKSTKSTKSTKSAEAPTFKRPSAQPKRPQSAYNFFNAEMQTQMKDMEKFKNMPFGQRVQVVSQSWNKLGEEQKTEYTKCADEDKKRFERETKLLEKKGWFKTKDGKDSRDLYKAPKGEAAEKKAESPKKKGKTLKASQASSKSKKSSKSQSKPKTKKQLKIEEKEKKQKIEDKEKARIERKYAVTPKKVFSAFFYFAMENQPKVKKENPEMSICEVAKKNGQDYAKLTDQQKKKYYDLREKDKIRYQKEIEEYKETGFYTDSNGLNSKFMDHRHRVQEFARGTVMPKSARAPYVIYFKEQHDHFKSLLKEGEKYKVIEKTKEISESWAKLTAQKKQKYEKLNQKDQERVNKQLEDLRKNGFFTDENGVKSTDMVFKPKKRPVRKAKKEEAATEEAKE